MPFPYYARLGRRDKMIYDRSDAIARIDLPGVEGLRPMVAILEEGLARDDRRVVEAAAGPGTVRRR